MIIQQTDASFHQVKIIHRAGDSFSKLIWRKRDLVQENPEVWVPGNLTGSSFHLQVRYDALDSNILLDLTNDYFDIGQSQEAIDYDIAQENPAGTTLDELYCEASGELFRFVPGEWQWDLQWTDSNNKVRTPIGGKFILISDVTRMGAAIIR